MENSSQYVFHKHKHFFFFNPFSGSFSIITKEVTQIRHNTARVVAGNVLVLRCALTFNILLEIKRNRSFTARNSRNSPDYKMTNK